MGNNNENPSSAVAYLAEQSALIRSGGYWNCLTAAREITARLLAEGRRPWLGRLRKVETTFEGKTAYVPLTPRTMGISITWITHYVGCCDGEVFDPVAGRPTDLEIYALEVFGEDIPVEIFVTTDDLPAFLVDDPQVTAEKDATV